MGAFFTNIQVKAIDNDLTLTEKHLIEQIKAIHTQNGYELVDNEDKADKTTIIVSIDNSPWVSIYDEETESQKIEMLDKLAEELSKELETIVLSLLVNDSDYIYIGLSKNGKHLDYISNLDDFTNLTKKKPKVWNEIIPGNTFEDIQTAWDNKTVFVESFLAAFGELANIDQRHISMGYNYWLQENPNAGIKLHFAKKKQELQKQELEQVKLNMLAREGELNFSNNNSNRIKWTIRNSGEASTGLEIMITGNCIENQSIKPISVIVKPLEQNGDSKEYKIGFIETATTSGEKLFYLRIEDLPIPKGIQPIKSSNLTKMQNYYKALYDSAINIEIVFSGLKECEDELKLFICPLENKQNGCYYECMTVVIHAN